MTLDIRLTILAALACGLVPCAAPSAAAGAPPRQAGAEAAVLAEADLPPGRPAPGRARAEQRADRKDKSKEKYRHWHRDRTLRVPPGRRRIYRDIIVVRPYGRWYHGYGHHHHDDDAFKWLAFTAITLTILDLLNESQQRAHKAAQIRATQAPVGETIYWHQDGASASVATTRQGTSSSGRYCREFQQTVTIGGRTEEAYGTACQQPDGAWEVVSTR